MSVPSDNAPEVNGQHLPYMVVNVADGKTTITYHATPPQRYVILPDGTTMPLDDYLAQRQNQQPSEDLPDQPDDSPWADD